MCFVYTNADTIYKLYQIWPGSIPVILHSNLVTIELPPELGLRIRIHSNCVCVPLNGLNSNCQFGSNELNYAVSADWKKSTSSKVGNSNYSNRLRILTSSNWASDGSIRIVNSDGINLTTLCQLIGLKQQSECL